ncbi:MAG TPA: hypothetical protein PK251_10160 [Candidatus Latescibacteria bacterium]|nr:hypothetical protein [Candidatus Latescibacterota bacterium]HOF61224.1 hypothetical protein [Candidatus Latescibacterota bacterium]HOS65103.1 hypothetical protein [Candidatus Latescibacterota bacterium]HPK74320.1 hypothetical protein [Candidatus Latescibacterota bacterium]
MTSSVSKAVAALFLAVFSIFGVVSAGVIRDGVLMVDGKPFFPLGSWNFSITTPEDIARLGMNVSYRGGPSTPEAVEQFRPFMRQCNRLGIQVVPYLSYGGAGVIPWAPEAVRAISRLASEPNLLLWYVGDDITMRHLEGIQQTVSILRQEAPSVPTAADYIAKATPEAKTTFTQFVDIRCQYSYPIPNDSLRSYMRFFDEQREFVGDPLWTWVQNFMWASTGVSLGLGIEDGPGPIPDPEQVRLLAFAAINRGVRGLLFFPHHELHLQPELAAEVALTCREIGLVSSHLAAGKTTFDLPTSDPDLNATAFRYGNSTVVSAMLARGHYHRWVDEAVVKNVWIEVPWSERGSSLPTAVLVATPDAVNCVVSRAQTPGWVRVRVPSLELAGFILLSTDSREIAQLRRGVQRITEQLSGLAVAGSIAQTRKVSAAAWSIGFGNLYDAGNLVLPAVRLNEQAMDAVKEGNEVAEVRLWREANRVCRTVLDSMMVFAEARRALVPAAQQRYLNSPYGLYAIKNLMRAPAVDDPWHHVAQWEVTGPFPLEYDQNAPDVFPPGFERVYPPENATASSGPFATVDGPASWKPAVADITGITDFLNYFSTTDNVVCYARTTVTAPRDTTMEMSIGSNDGAKVWVNGTEVLSIHPPGGRAAAPHQNKVTVNLRAGRNVVLAKVENLGLNWQLYLSFRDENRVLKFSTD